MEKLDLDKIDSIDIEEYTQKKIKEIDSKIEHVFHVYEDTLDETLESIVETTGYLTNQLYKERLLTKYYTHCFNHIKESLLVKYKYGSIRDLERIDSMIENSEVYKKYDGMVFSQNLICEHIEMRIKIIKNQIFNIKDIIDIKRIESA